MTASTGGRRIRRAISWLGVATSSLGLLACAGSEPFQVATSNDADIRAEDVQEIPIQEIRARERAGREASRCGPTTRPGATCEDHRSVEIDTVFGPDPELDFE